MGEIDYLSNKIQASKESFSRKVEQFINEGNHNL